MVRGRCASKLNSAYSHNSFRGKIYACNNKNNNKNKTSTTMHNGSGSRYNNLLSISVVRFVLLLILYLQFNLLTKTIIFRIVVVVVEIVGVILWFSLYVVNVAPHRGSNNDVELPLNHHDIIDCAVKERSEGWEEWYCRYMQAELSAENM